MSNLNQLFQVGEAGLSEDSTTPLYLQIIQIISDSISSGRLKEHDKLPTEPELMELFHVSRVTLRAAMRELVDNGVLVRRQGIGTFVNTSTYFMSVNNCAGFTASCKKAGKEPRTQLLSIELIIPDRTLARFFKIEEAEKILFIKRLRYIDDQPVIMEYNYFSKQLFSLMNEDTQRLETSIYQLLSDSYHFTTLQGKFEFNTCLPTKEEQSLLNVSKNTPLLLTSDWHYTSPNHEPLFLSKQVSNGEFINFYFDININLSN